MNFKLPRSKEKNTREIKSYFTFNFLKYILEEKPNINYLSLYLKRWQKEEQIKQEGGRKKDSLKMKMEIGKTENLTMEKINKIKI